MLYGIFVIFIMKTKICMFIWPFRFLILWIFFAYNLCLFHHLFICLCFIDSLQIKPIVRNYLIKNFKVTMSKMIKRSKRMTSTKNIAFLHILGYSNKSFKNKKRKWKDNNWEISRIKKKKGSQHKEYFEY